MLKLLIVDDEPLVQMGIRSMLQHQSDLEITICGTASNGVDALNKIQTLSPEIVICDIKMPIMDGLELAQKCNTLYGRLPIFIMLTSYDEFELARRAIQCQVCDYLIKIDLTSAVLINSLKKAATIVSEYNRSDSLMEIKAYSDNFFIQLLNHLLDYPSIIKQAKNLSIDIDYSSFIVAYGAITTKSPLDSMNQHQYLTLHSSTLNMLQEIINKYTANNIVPINIDHFAIIFCFSSSQNKTIYRIVKEALEDSTSLLRSYFSINLFFGIGSVVNNIMEIDTSFYEAKEALSVNSDYHCSLAFYTTILKDRKEFEKNKLIFDIQHYIDSHLTERITLDSISKIFGISPAYLSNFFKKVTGYTFIDYVNHKKIEISKTLLKEQRMKIYEIADYLGFDNTYYYSKVFRKYVGCSPSDFINKKIEN